MSFAGGKTIESSISLGVPLYSKNPSTNSLTFGSTPVEDGRSVTTIAFVVEDCDTEVNAGLTSSNLLAMGHSEVLGNLEIIEKVKRDESLLKSSTVK